MTVISEIVRFQTDRGLDKKKYDALNEHANIFEELLESLGINTPKESRENLKYHILEMVEEIRSDRKAEDLTDQTTEDEVDAYCDVIVFAIGALLKLGYDPEKALTETTKEINSRSGRMVDGKFEKYTSEAAKNLQYKANYDICKR